MSRTRGWPIPDAFLPVAALLLLLALPGRAVAAGGTSRHCPVDKAPRMNQGTYPGTYSVIAFFDGGEAQMNMQLMLRIHGDMTVNVDSAGSVTSVQGTARYFFGGAGTRGKGMGGAISFDGGGPLQLFAGGTESFTVSSNITAPGGAMAFGPNAVASKKGTGSGELRMQFVVRQATCDVMGGDFGSPQVGQTVDAMRAKGFQVSGDALGTWTASTGSDTSKKIKELLEELQQKPPPGIVRTREAEGRRLGAIADRIKKGPPEQVPCLIKVWMQHVRQTLADYVYQDGRKLRAYKGDLPGLEGLMRQALEADRMLSLVGMDTCEERLHEELWGGMDRALSRVLNRMAEGHAPIADVLRILKSAELLGVVSPALETKVMAAISSEAKKIADVKYKIFKDAQAAHAKEPCHAEILVAFRNALTAEKVYVLVSSSDFRRAIDDVPRFQGCR